MLGLTAAARATSGAWTLADFNGDHRPDMVTASSSRNDTGNYTHRVQIGLGEESGSLTFASNNARIRLSARDVDGDHDTDLVVMGIVSSKPIDVWLNDGTGHFRHGDVTGLAAESENASLEASASDDDTPAGLSDEQNPLAEACSVLWVLDGGADRAAAPYAENPLSSDRPHLRNRAPPR
jgi:hypothetical protein